MIITAYWKWEVYLVKYQLAFIKKYIYLIELKKFFVFIVFSEGNILRFFYFLQYSTLILTPHLISIYFYLRSVLSLTENSLPYLA